MAQPKALKSQYGQGPAQLEKSNAAAAGQEDLTDFSDFVQPVQMQEGDDIIPPETAIPGTARGLPEEQATPGNRPFVGPYNQEYYQGGAMPGAEPQLPYQYQQMYGISPESVYTAPPSEKEVEDLISTGQLGVSVALGAAFPALGALGVATSEAAVSLFFDSLRNAVNTDEKQISTPKMIFNSALSGITAGATSKASQWLLGKIIGKAAKEGDDLVLDQAKKAMEEKFGSAAVKEAIETAEGAGVKLSPAEAFPFDKEAQAATVEGLREHPGLGVEFAKKIGQYKRAIIGLFADTVPMEKSGTIRDFVDETVKSYRSRIGSIQSKLNQAGADIKDVRMDGQKLLSTLDERMKQINGDLKDDVLNSVAPEMNTIRNELSNALKVAEADEFIGGAAGNIVDASGVPIKRTKEAAKLTLNDIEKFRDRITKLTDSAYEKLASRQPLTRSEEIAKAMYKDVARIRDEMSEQIANKIGRPELANEIKALRSEYSKKIDAWEMIQDRLSKAPVDELKYLFPKNDPELAGKIVSVLNKDQVAGLKQEFISRLIDPVYLREAGEQAVENSLTGARKALKSYDEGVLTAIYSPDELKSIRRFLDLGERTETVLKNTGMPIEKIGSFKQIVGLVSNPSSAGVLSKFIDNLSTKNPLRKALDYKLYLAGKRQAGDLPADLVKSLGAPEPTSVEAAQAQVMRAREALQRKIPAQVKRAGQGAAQVGGRAAGQELREAVED